MKISDIDNSVRITDLENMFDIYEDGRGNNVFNINETLYINVDDEMCDLYTLKTNAYWPLISYKIYNTTHLTWFLMKLNKIDGDQIFNMKRAGDRIKYLPIKTVESIIGGL